MLEPAGGGVAVHPAAERIAQDRTVVAVADSPVDGSADRWRQRDEDDLAAFAGSPSTCVGDFGGLMRVGNGARRCGA
jgi:hypothetical protein